MPKSRREREKEEMKERILQTASRIIGEKGFDQLSIRQIAKEIEYSPSIVYHYFKDKEDIVNQVMQRGYGKIISSIAHVDPATDTPEGQLSEMTRNYIEAALKMPDEFLAAQTNDSEVALKQMTTLYKGSSKERPALNALCQSIREINKDVSAQEEDIENTAQLIAVATLGLIVKLIVEKGVDETHKNTLINRYCDEMVIRMAKRGE
ncbi:MAG TPA: TetR/AcrR family transcriptional regulator [Eubacteriaceae bacterium]|nr:TetR/AcrR family transcriptional regulator [Eubacteriaceae bacterium]